VLSEIAHADDAAICAEKKVLLALRGLITSTITWLQVTASIGIVAYPEDGARRRRIEKC